MCTDKHYAAMGHALNVNEIHHQLVAPAGEAGLLQMRLGPNMTVHAPTGALLWQFREVVLLGTDPDAARVAHFTQPDWTHR